MELTERNFIRLLCCGIFGSDDALEPMSYWKWQRLFRMSLNHGVSALVYDGIEKRGADFRMNIPDDIRETWRANVKEIEEFSRATTESTAQLIRQFQKDQLRPIILKGASMATLYPTPCHRTGGDCDILFPYEPQATKADEWVRTNASRVEQRDNNTLAYLWEGMVVENHRQMSKLTNTWLNRRLQKIIDKEIRCCDSTYVNIGNTRAETPSPTLSLLIELVRIARYIVSDGLKLKQLVDLGVMLRTIGAKVDFVKLQNWIDMLHGRLAADVAFRLHSRRTSILQPAPFVRLLHASHRPPLLQRHHTQRMVFHPRLRHLCEFKKFKGDDVADKTCRPLFPLLSIGSDNKLHSQFRTFVVAY